MTPLSERSPVEIDTEILKLTTEHSRLDALNEGLRRTASRHQEIYETYGSESSRKAVEDANAQAAINTVRMHDINDRLHVLQSEWVRRGRWTRYYLVTNSNGHVHWTQDCTTCFIDTQFAWLTQFSGTSHDDLVELAGEKACTVCFPNAPVDVLKRASKLTTPEREAREAEKAAKAQAAAESQVVVENYSDGGMRSRTYTHTFKTVRGATNALASTLGSLVWYGETHSMAAGWISDIAEIRKALAAKGVEYDYDKALANARKKAVKDGGVARY